MPASVQETMSEKMSAFMRRVWNYQFTLDGDIFSVKECVCTFAGCLIGLAFVMGTCYVLG